MRSSNGAQTWATVKPTPPLYGVRTLQFASAQIGWAVDALNGNWEILQTADGGSTWLPVFTPS